MGASWANQPSPTPALYHRVERQDQASEGDGEKSPPKRKGDAAGVRLRDRKAPRHQDSTLESLRRPAGRDFKGRWQVEEARRLSYRNV